MLIIRFTSQLANTFFTIVKPELLILSSRSEVTFLLPPISPVFDRFVFDTLLIVPGGYMGICPMSLLSGLRPELKSNTIVGSNAALFTGMNRDNKQNKCVRFGGRRQTGQRRTGTKCWMVSQMAQRQSGAEPALSRGLNSATLISLNEQV